MNDERSERLAELVHKYRNQRNPFVVGVLGNFSGRPDTDRTPPVRSRVFVDAEWHRIDRLMAFYKPRISLQVEDTAGVSVPVDLEFRSLADFDPQIWIEKVPWLGKLTREALAQSGGLETGHCERLDTQLATKVAAILHRPEFQNLEATWRGLHQLALRLPADSRVRIRLLDINKFMLGRDLRRYRGTTWDESPIFKKVHEEEYGTLGGQPFNLIIGDYDFSHDPKDLETLGDIAKICAAAHVVFLAQASPRLFGFDSFVNASGISQPTRLFKSAAYVAWRSLAESDDGKYVALALPRVLMRRPYEYPIREQVDDTRQLLWGNPAYLLGAELASAFVHHLGYAGIPEIPLGGILSGVEPGAIRSDHRLMMTNVEAEFQAETRGEFESLGLICLRKLRDNGRIAYAPPCSIGAANRSGISKRSRYLPDLLVQNCALHQLKALLRAVIADEIRLEDVQSLVDRWLAQEVSGEATPSLAERIRSPLARASFMVTRQESTGALSATYNLEAHSFAPDDDTDPHQG
jgi:type VI secretion system protein ImpC